MTCVLAQKSNVWYPPKGRRTLILCGYYKINTIVVAADAFQMLAKRRTGNVALIIRKLLIEVNRVDVHCDRSSTLEKLFTFS